MAASFIAWTSPAGRLCFWGNPWRGSSAATPTTGWLWQRNGDGSLKNSVRLTIDDIALEYSGVIAAEYQDAQYRTSALVGLALYGPADESGYSGEGVRTENRRCIIRARRRATRCPSRPSSSSTIRARCGRSSRQIQKWGATIRNYGGTAYSMAFADEGLGGAAHRYWLRGSAEHWFVSQTSLPSSLPNS